MIEDLPLFLRGSRPARRLGKLGQGVLRPMVKVPVALGAEIFSDKWQWIDVIENKLIDYARVTVPNVGGVSEFMKITAMCEAHPYRHGLSFHRARFREATSVHCVAATLRAGHQRKWRAGANAPCLI